MDKQPPEMTKVYWKALISSGIIVLLICLSVTIYFYNFFYSQNLESKVEGLNLILEGQSGYYLSQIAFLDKTNKTILKELEDIEALTKKNSSLANDRVIQEKINAVILSAKIVSDMVMECRKNALIFKYDTQNYIKRFFKVSKKR